MRRLWTVIMAAGICLLPAMPAQAEQPVRLVFPFAAGSSADALARLVAEQLRMDLNRGVIVENRTGAAGRLGVQAVKSAAPDGNTLLLSPIAPMAVYQHVYPSLEYDPVGDFEPIAQLVTFDFAVAIGPQVPVRSLGELVEWVKANPAHANYGSPAAGTLPHFFAVLFGREAKLDLRHVTYKGTAAAMIDLLGGQIPMLFSATSELLEMHKAGKIRILATSDTARSAFLPDVPTFKETGYDIHGVGWHGLYAPVRTPSDALDRINKAAVAAVQKPEVRDRLIAMGFRPTGTSREALTEIQRRDAELWAPAVKASGFRPQQ